MIHSYPLIPVHYIAQINDYLCTKGIQTGQWLKEVGLSENDVIEDSIMLEYGAYERLILSAIELSQEKDIGLRLGKSLSIYSHGALSFALLNCKSVEEVLSLFKRYLLTRTPLLSVVMTGSNKQICIQLEELYDINSIRHCFLEAVAMMFSHLLNVIMPSDEVLLEVAFPYAAPDYAEEYGTALGCKVCFGATCLTLILDKSLVTKQLPAKDLHSLFQATQLCEQELAKVNQLSSLASRVRLILMNSREQFLDLPQIANKLNITPRTLHRRLKSEQTSYKAILDQVRHTLAKQYLSQDSQSVKHIAYILGYADVANFRRAFKRWEGVSPIAYKQSCNS